MNPDAKICHISVAGVYECIQFGADKGDCWDLMVECSYRYNVMLLVGQKRDITHYKFFQHFKAQ